MKEKCPLRDLNFDLLQKLWPEGASGRGGISNFFRKGNAPEIFLLNVHFRLDAALKPYGFVKILGKGVFPGSLIKSLKNKSFGILGSCIK